MNAVDLYLELVKRSLVRDLTPESDFFDAYEPVTPAEVDVPGRIGRRAVERFLEDESTRVFRRSIPDHARLPDDPEILTPRQLRRQGRILSRTADTLIGVARLDNLRKCVEDVIARDVPGDLLEAGVFRGGASIYMRAVLAAHSVTDRLVWLADSFEGLPEPDAQRFPSDQLFVDWGWHGLVACSLDEVKGNFERYGLLDDQVRFIKGWFSDTMVGAPVERLAILRMDADYYSSTTEVLDALYPRLSVGGYVIVDDYGDLEPCKKAIDDYRARESITAPLVEIDHTGVYWRRDS